MSGLTEDEELELLELEEEEYQASLQEEAPEISEERSLKLGSIQGVPFVGTWADEAEAAYKALTGPEKYTEARDKIRSEYKAAEQANPNAYMAGIMAPSLAIAPIKSIPVIGTALSGLAGLVEGAGASEEEDISGVARDAALSSLISAGTAGIGGKISQSLAKRAEKPAEKVGGYIKEGAKRLAEGATGATAGEMINKLKPGSGKKLLDEGILKWHDSPGTLARRLEGMTEKSGKEIGEVLKKLDLDGPGISSEEIAARIAKKAQELRQNPALVNEAAKLEGILSDMRISQGISDIDIPLRPITASDAEKFKREFSKKSTNWSDPQNQVSNKEAYRAYRDAVEKVAEKKDPALLEKLKKEKETFGLLTPIKEAAERRDKVTNQSPFLGLMDVASMGLGAGAGGYLGGAEGSGLGLMAGAMARRAIAPRVKPFAAVGFDKLGDMVKQSPGKFGKFAPVLLNASQRGGNSLGAAHYLLYQQNPEYREMLDQINEEENNE